MMTQTISRFEELVSQFLHARSGNPPRAGAVDPSEFWKRLVLKAIDGGYFKSTDEFVLFIEACMRFLSSEQVMQDRGYGHGIRDLAEALARNWAGGPAPDNAPTADQIAGLLQSEWVTSGQFKLLKSASAGCDTG